MRTRFRCAVNAQASGWALLTQVAGACEVLNRAYSKESALTIKGIFMTKSTAKPTKKPTKSEESGARRASSRAKKSAQSTLNPEKLTFREQMDQLLVAALPFVNDIGWEDSALTHGAKKIGLDEQDVQKLFPTGIEGVIHHFLDWADRQMVSTAQDEAFVMMRVREKVAFLIWNRLKLLTPYKDAVRGLSLRNLQPWNSMQGLRGIRATVDKIWHTAGDSLSDRTRFTKRLTLTSVYLSTFMFWLNDHSKDQFKTEIFLERRMKTVLRFGNVVGRARTVLNRVEDVCRVFMANRMANRAATRTSSPESSGQ